MLARLLLLLTTPLLQGSRYAGLLFALVNEGSVESRGRHRHQRLHEPQGYWDYGDNGASWDMGGCQQGQQSPVNLSLAQTITPDPEILFHRYGIVEEPLTMQNDGRVLSILVEGNSLGGISLGAVTWDLKQIVLHSPSEHTFGGRQVPLEMQLFHGLAGEPLTPKATAVVSMGFVASPQPLFFLESLRQGGLPDQVGTSSMVNRQTPAALNFRQLFNSTFLEYSGSLTMPPCSTGVRWFVRSQPVPAKLAALDDFRHAIRSMSSLHQDHPGNARQLQSFAASMKVIERTTQIVEGSAAARDPEFERAAMEAETESDSLASSLHTSEQEKEEQEKEKKYQACAMEINIVRQKLESAKAQISVECGSLEQARSTLPTVGQGLTRIQFLKRIYGLDQLCKANKAVEKRLEKELATWRSHCSKLKTTSPPEQTQEQSSEESSEQPISDSD